MNVDLSDLFHMHYLRIIRVWNGNLSKTLGLYEKYEVLFDTTFLVLLVRD